MNQPEIDSRQLTIRSNVDLSLYTFTAAEILDLDKRLSRAVQNDRYLRLSPNDLRLLVQIGLMNIMGEVRSEYLKEISKCRTSGASTPEAISGSTLNGGTVSQFPVRFTSSGTTRRVEKSEGRARAGAMFG